MRSWRHQIGTAVFSALLMVGTAAAAEPGTCVGISFTEDTVIFADNFESGGPSAWVGGPPQFPATKVLEIEVTFDDGFTGDHVLHLKLTTPNGHHYQTLTAPISSSAEQRGASRTVRGYPRPLAVRVLAPATAEGLSGNAVTLELPVGGTAIVSSALYGTWTAEAFVDDDLGVCAAGQFVLTP